QRHQPILATARSSAPPRRHLCCFVQYLATYAYKHGQDNEQKALTYTDLSQTVQNSDTFQFLADIVPKKILASKYLKMLEKEKEGKEIREEEEEEETEESEAEDAS
ncbi:PREDICTED: chromatin accessibility complex protein 1, partial [Thamnophis sirtalis]|uniref:Chromatin accessibility complex protein 1 n=1 Tax=Thamnophis sirtalis TaxID=35019 RepID=A0A6I9YH91_9SAUR